MFASLLDLEILHFFVILKISHLVSKLHDGATRNVVGSSTSASASSMDVEFDSIPSKSIDIEVEYVVPTSDAGHLTFFTPADVSTSGVW